MKRILTTGIGLLAAIAVITPALADEPPPTKKAKPARVTRSAPPPRAEAPVRQASKSWSGGQVGGSNGGSFANNSFVEPGSYICPPGTELGNYCYETPFSFNEKAPSYTFGAFLGYRLQFGNFVVGVEGDASYKNSNSSVSQVTQATLVGAPEAYFDRNDNFNGTLKQGWDGSVRGRLGVLITPSILVYGTGGVAFGKVSGSLTYTGTISDDGTNCDYNRAYICGTATSATSFSETRVGATGGGGVEMQLFGPWNARLEYRYTDLGKFTKSFPVVSTGACVESAPYYCGTSPGASIELHPTFHTVRFGVGLDF